MVETQRTPGDHKEFARSVQAKLNNGFTHHAISKHCQEDQQCAALPLVSFRKCFVFHS
jgi:hypothetical protein